MEQIRFTSEGERNEVRATYVKKKVVEERVRKLMARRKIIDAFLDLNKGN